MTKQPSVTFTSLILFGYGLILVALLGLGWFTAANIEQLRVMTLNLYIHPFAVSNAATDLKGSLFQLRNHMLQIVLLRDKNDDLEKLRQQADALDKTIRTDLATIKDNFLGDMNRVNELEGKLDQWDVIRAEILSAAQKGDMETAERLVRHSGTPKFNEIAPLVDYVLEFAKGKAKILVDEAERHTEQILFRLHCMVAFLVIFLVATGVTVLMRVRRLQNELHCHATIDFLTGIPNRRHFMELADWEFARGMRYGAPFAFALSDLDFFKKINDTHGHHAGDQVLKEFGDICRKTLRNSDIVGRWGGEEFALLLPNTTLPVACHIVDRLRAAVEASDSVVEQALPIKFTASFGLTTFFSGDCDMRDLIRRADEALYSAKESGRNKVCVVHLETSKTL
jgi:diguanylate cyclase (GGDEF)-like protein